MSIRLMSGLITVRWRYYHVGLLLDGLLSLGLMSSRAVVYWATVLSGYCLLGLCPLSRCPSGIMFCRATVQETCILWLTSRSGAPEVFLGERVLEICSKFAGEHPCKSVIAIKLLCIFIEIALRHGCSPVNLLYIFRSSFYMNTSGGLILNQTGKEILAVNIISKL